ncbi:MAG: hypothetical protein VX948_09380 [Candidatus Latescibacterota bacterium]|nr:hypothetical protein [Candidatus Latescibacterota bacterium]
MTSWIEGEEPAGSVDDACQLGVTTRQLHAIPAQGRDLPTTTFSPP